MPFRVIVMPHGWLARDPTETARGCQWLEMWTHGEEATAGLQPVSAINAPISTVREHRCQR